MRQVFLERDTLAVKHVSQPLLDDYSILVEVHYSCISSEDELTAVVQAIPSRITADTVSDKVKKFIESLSSHGVVGSIALLQGKLYSDTHLLGSSCSGLVLAVGKKVRQFRTGDFVACAGAGFANHADIVCIPSNLAVRISNHEALKYASMTMLGALALQTIRRADIKLGETVCVIGLGLVGQLALLLAKRAGCRVFALDSSAHRLALARTLGADQVINTKQQSAASLVAAGTQQYGADATLVTLADTVEHAGALALEITRKKGKVSLIGPITLDAGRLGAQEKEIDLLMNSGYSTGRYDAAYEKQAHDYPYCHVRWTENRNMQLFVELVERNQLPLATLITQEVNIENVKEIYPALQAKQELGVILNYIPHVPSVMPVPMEAIKSSSNKAITFMPATRDALRIGLIGAGEFACTKLLPAVHAMKHAVVTAIVDTNNAHALTLAKRYAGCKAFTDDRDLFSQDLVDVVVIASPDVFHATQAVRALESGKAVFMEKPMVTDFEQFALLKDFLIAHPSIPFCVDYNRSFAPFIQKIKNEVASRISPLMIQYRVNAGFIPKEHWIQSDKGAGRLIGEACQILDLFCFLTDSKPMSVSLEALHARHDNLFPTDNFSVQINFVDGSICTLLYTSLGHKELGKERMEILYDAKAIVMDDYDYLAGYGLAKSFDETVLVGDLGHEALLRRFLENLKYSFFTPPIPLDRLCTVAALTLLIDQLACEGGGTKEVKL